MSRVTLPNDQWAELREVGEFRQKDRRVAAGAWDDTQGGFPVQLMAFTDRVITLALKNWSLEQPLPTVDDQAPIDALDFETYDALAEAVQPILTAMRGGKERLGDPKDPESPTEPSTA